jgi:membrane protein DedA with SNARE-associated domain
VLSNHLANLISAHGYWIVAVVVALESMGIPAPGETALVTAAIFAGTTQRLSIAWVIAAAASGAIVGDSVGYLIGRRFGHAMLLKYGHLARIDTKRITIGQYLFARHGGKVVFFGRFIAVLRAIAALLAGTNCMDWRRFFFFNASGGVVWAAAYGMGAYLFAERFQRVHGTVTYFGLVLAGAACAAAFWWMRRHEAALAAKAAQALPDLLLVTSKQQSRNTETTKR